MAAAAVINKAVFSARLPDIYIFSTETKANLLLSIYTYFTIFSDSLSCLQALHSMNFDHPYILDILYSYYHVSDQGKIVNFCWIPSLIGIQGNNEADICCKIRNRLRKFFLHSLNILLNSI